MRFLEVGAATLNQTPLDWDGNLRRIESALAQARERQVAVLALPEMCITGYGCEDAFHAPSVQRLALEVLEAILPATRGMIVAVGLPFWHQDAVYNTACLVADGEPLGLVCKRALAGDGIHYEPRWFKPWPAGARSRCRILGRELPIGDVHFDFTPLNPPGNELPGLNYSQIESLQIGFEICEDAWVTQRPGRELSLAGVDVVLNTSASHFAFGKHQTRERLVLEGSRALGVHYVYSNLMGNEAGRVIYDGGALIASSGRLVARGPRFSLQEVELTHALVDIDLSRVHRAKVASYAPGVAAEGRVRCEFRPTLSAPRPQPTPRPDWESDSENLKSEEFSRAVTLGLFDYMRKSRSKGFVVSLSGGADSTAVAALCRMSLERATHELETTDLKQRLSYWPELFDGDRARPEAWLTTVYQATKNSSETTRDAAASVAEALGATHHFLDIESLARGYVELVEEAMDQLLDWQHHDIPLQNIQARARAPGVWLIANLRRALLLSTSNRSEAAVGYATMDGDTAGGLSPIAGIDKAYLLAWLRWLEVRGPAGYGPEPCVSVVNQLKPTAELRPEAAAQTDETDLMPYPVLDYIERAAIRDARSPAEIYGLLAVHFPQYSRADHLLWLERFFRLWSQNQWKRERYAPSFHLDDENLDPKTWCRFPILSGGYARELRELRAAAAAEAP
ncbi:MAG: NAD(+) synthase [Polyangiaceae bacterium]